MGPHGPDPAETPTKVPDKVPDNVTRMKALLARNTHVTWLQPGQAGVPHHTATWLDPDIEDPRKDGTAVTVSREDLGMLVNYLEARLGL